MSVVIHMWDEVSDVIDDAKELLYLFPSELLIWKVEQFLGNALSWLAVSVFDNYSKEFNIICCNGAFLG